MNGNAELLNYTYQNAQMGLLTIDPLTRIIPDEDFKKQLEDQLQEYQDVFQKAKEMLHENGLEEKGIGTCAKLKTYLALRLQTARDGSPSHVAEMLILGSSMGIIDAIKNLKQYQDADEGIRTLLQKLLAYEEDNVQQLKRFL